LFETGVSYDRIKQLEVTIF
jgi:Ca2+-binding EF-hand superfamily protein